jgi:hypothetical protein
MNTARTRASVVLFLFVILCLGSIVAFHWIRSADSDRPKANNAVRLEDGKQVDGQQAVPSQKVQSLANNRETDFEGPSSRLITKAKEVWKTYGRVKIGMELALLMRVHPGLTYEGDWVDASVQYDASSPYEVFNEVVDAEPVLGVRVFGRYEVSRDCLAGVLAFFSGERKAMGALWLTSFDTLQRNREPMARKIVTNQEGQLRPTVLWEVDGVRIGVRYSRGTGIPGDPNEHDYVTLTMFPLDYPKSPKLLDEASVSDDEKERLFAEVGVPFGVADERE